MGRPLSLLRGDGAGQSWELAARPPHPALRAHVRRLVGFRETSDVAVRRLEMPSSTVTLIVGFDGDGWGISLPWLPDAPRRRRTAFVAGLHGTAAVTDQRGRVAGVQVDLTPAGAHELLAVSMAELAGQVAALDEGFGADPATRALPARLAAAPDWAARLDLIDAWLAARLPVAPAGSPEVAWALARLHRSGGTVAVGALADEIGWSRRHLAARFREQVGVTPKALARLLRFERAVGALAGARPDEADLGRLALDCGYYDQSHFNRDFRAFAGVTPSVYLARRASPGAGISAEAMQQVTSVQDPARAAA